MISTWDWLKELVENKGMKTTRQVYLQLSISSSIATFYFMCHTAVFNQTFMIYCLVFKSK